MQAGRRPSVRIQSPRCERRQDHKGSCWISPHEGGRDNLLWSRRRRWYYRSGHEKADIRPEGPELRQEHDISLSGSRDKRTEGNGSFSATRCGSSLGQKDHLPKYARWEVLRTTRNKHLRRET